MWFLDKLFMILSISTRYKKMNVGQTIADVSFVENDIIVRLNVDILHMPSHICHILTHPRPSPLLRRNNDRSSSWKKSFSMHLYYTKRRLQY